jgi:hypothetical protein
MCRTVADHEWGPEYIAGARIHPVLGQMIEVKQKCDYCDRVRHSMRPGTERPAYHLAHTTPAVAAELS